MDHRTIARRLARARQGAAMTEYVILLGLIGVVTIWSVGQLGLKIGDTYSTITEEIAMTAEDPEQEIGGPSGSDPVITSPVLPDTSECTTISTSNYYGTSSDPSATCYYEDFSWKSDGEVWEPAGFGFEAQSGPVFFDPAPNKVAVFSIDTSPGDDVAVISGPDINITWWGSAGTDGIVFESLSSSEMSWVARDEFGMTWLMGSTASEDIVVDIRQCDIQFVEFTDGLMTASEIFAAATPDADMPGTCS